MGVLTFCEKDIKHKTSFEAWFFWSEENVQEPLQYDSAFIQLFFFKQNTNIE